MDNLQHVLKNKTIAYQGVPGAYSHQCLHMHFPFSDSQGHVTFEGAIRAVENGEADYALLPVENSIAGRVMDIHHLLAHSTLNILAEYYHPIIHCLLARENACLDTITQVYSHPMALAQCRAFLHKHNLQTVPFADTADAAAFIAHQNSLNIAAIAASSNIDLYKGLKIIQKHIQDTSDNTTRFFLLGGKTYDISTRQSDVVMHTCITAIFFTVKNIPAALYKALESFATYAVNVIKLESFMPMRGNGVAQFYIEIEGIPNDAAVSKALKLLQDITTHVRILGSFVKSIE